MFAAYSFGVDVNFVMLFLEEILLYYEQIPIVQLQNFSSLFN